MSAEEADPLADLERIKAEAESLANRAAPAGSESAAPTTVAVVEQPWSPNLVRYLSTSILLFGIGVMLIMGWLVVRRGITQGVLRLICVPLIVVAAVFLMVVGYDDKQLSPIVGLLGTIAGYLLGKTEPPAAVADRSARRTRGRTEADEAADAAEPEPPAPIS